MDILKWVAYASWVVAGLLIILGISNEDIFIISSGISCGISGVLFYALERVVSLLTDIRDSLSGEKAPSKHIAREVSEIAPPEHNRQAAEKPVRTLSEISADLDKMKARLNDH